MATRKRFSGAELRDLLCLWFRSFGLRNLLVAADRLAIWPHCPSGGNRLGGLLLRFSRGILAWFDALGLAMSPVGCVWDRGVSRRRMGVGHSVTVAVQ